MTTSVRIAGDRRPAGPPIPEGVAPRFVSLATFDGARVTGLLYGLPWNRTVAVLTHPRQDMSQHPLVGHMLKLGVAVWVQQVRSVNNDVNLIHEQALLDQAAGHVFLRESGFDTVITVGHSGGGALQAMYHAQSGREPQQRIQATPSGKPVALAGAAMPRPDGAIFIAPHPGQGKLLERVIDPSVVDERDPLGVDPELDPYASANGFCEAPEWSRYTDEFKERYFAAQRERVSRLDERALELAADANEAARRYKRTQAAEDRRRVLAPRLLTVYRTDADLRSVDRTIDSNDRPYGSLFGTRPDLTNYGLLGFGRLTTAESWLSTWSSNHTNATFETNAPGVVAPTILVGFTGDQAAFPSDLGAISRLLGASDLTVTSVPGTHFGGALAAGGATGFELAEAEISAWTRERFSTAIDGKQVASREVRNLNT